MNRVVPSIVDLPDINSNLRKELGIPLSAIVFGRTGGMDTWNISFTNEVVKKVCEVRDDIFFIFQINWTRFDLSRTVFSFILLYNKLFYEY